MQRVPIVAQAKFFSILTVVETSFSKMKFAVAVLLLLTPALGFSMEVATSSSLTFDAQGAKNRPVSKVIQALFSEPGKMRMGFKGVCRSIFADSSKARYFQKLCNYL